MSKIVYVALALVLVWGIAAWAEDDDWAEWDSAWAEFNGDAHSSHDVAERTLRASQPIYKNVVHEDGSTSQELVYYPDYPSQSDATAGYNPDQVYGPMWGVPGEAQGLDGYEPFYLMQYLGADPKDIPEEYRADVLRRQAQIEAGQAQYHAENPGHDAATPAPAPGAAPAPAPKQPAESGNAEEREPESDGIRDDSSSWLDG